MRGPGSSRRSFRGAELRGQRLLRKLITVDELEEILRVHLDEGFTLAQNAGGELFYRLITILSENEARTAGYAVLRSLQQLFRTERDAAKELCDKLRAETLPDKVRLAAVYRSLLALPGLEEQRSVVQPSPTLACGCPGARRIRGHAAQRRRAPRPAPPSNTRRPRAASGALRASTSSRSAPCALDTTKIHRWRTR